MLSSAWMFWLLKEKLIQLCWMQGTYLRWDQDFEYDVPSLLWVYRKQVGHSLFEGVWSHILLNLSERISLGKLESGED